MWNGRKLTQIIRAAGIFDLTPPYRGRSSKNMQYTVEIQRERETFAQVMSTIRVWLDSQRFEPNEFRCKVDDAVAIYKVAFKFESEARACAEAFGGQLASSGKFLG
jgi:hypothetical protein